MYLAIKWKSFFQKYCIAVNYQNKKRLLEYILCTRFLHICQILFWLPLEGLAQCPKLQPFSLHLFNLHNSSTWATPIYDNKKVKDEDLEENAL